MFRRTVDIDQLCFEGADVAGDEKSDSSEPWKSMSTEDYNGEQIWNRGVKGEFCCFYALNYHYDLDAGFSQWSKYQDSTRPILNLNTNNHLHGPEDRNPDLKKHVWAEYPVWEGNADDAELFGRTLAVHKCNLFSCFRSNICCCLQKLRPEPIDPNYFQQLPVFAADFSSPASPTAQIRAPLEEIALDSNGVNQENQNTQEV
jgi:hypothetical protein